MRRHGRRSSILSTKNLSKMHILKHADQSVRINEVLRFYLGRPAMVVNSAEHLAIPKPGLDTHAYGRRKTSLCDAAMILCPKRSEVKVVEESGWTWVVLAACLTELTEYRLIDQRRTACDVRKSPATWPACLDYVTSTSRTTSSRRWTAVCWTASPTVFATSTSARIASTATPTALCNRVCGASISAW